MVSTMTQHFTLLHVYHQPNHRFWWRRDLVMKRFCSGLIYWLPSEDESDF